MSEWTYVRGCIELSVDAFEQKKMKREKPWHLQLKGKLTEEEEQEWHAWRDEYMRKSYLPYPEEQFKICVPMPMTRYHKPTKKNPKDFEIDLVTSAKIFSLPKARKYLDHAFSLLPQGESGFRYAIKQDASDWSSATFCHFEHPCLKQYYKDAINKLYYHEDPWKSRDFDDLVEYRNLDKECSIDFVDSMVIGISESLRWCTSDELQSCLEEFFIYLVKNEFYLDNVLLEWHDNVEYHLLHRCVTGYGEECLRIETINTETNEVIYRKTFDYPRDEGGYIDYNSKEYNTREYIIKEEILGERPKWPEHKGGEDE